MLRKARLLISITALLIVGSAMAAADQPASKDAQQQLESAQQRLEEAAREVAELSSHMVDGNRDPIVFLGRNANRAIIGIVIDRSNDSDEGVRVLSVSPGGPAAGAGVKAGDVIVELNGGPLKRDKENDADQKLLSALSTLSPGDDVSLSYRRDSKITVVKLKAEKLSRTVTLPLFLEHQTARGGRPAFDRDMEFDILRGPRSMHMGAFGAIELVPLSPKLGQYFGTEKGLLMVRVPQDKELKLEDGDVLLDIDGRVPSNPGHAFRILGSYQPGETVTLNVMRQRKKMAIAITTPAHELRGPRPPLPPQRTERRLIKPPIA